MANIGICSFCGEKREIVSGMNGNLCKDCYDAIGDEFNTTVPILSKEEFKPHTLKAELDKYVVGQENAKKILCVAMYNHCKRIENPKLGLEKSNIIISGPTGCGKTYIMKTLAQIMDIPMVTVDATTFTEAGYVGEDVQFCLKKLLMATNGDLKKAQKGIVFVDETDKLANKDSSKDVNSVGVQQAFLKMMEGGDQTVTLDRNSGKGITFNTDNVLFVFGGAFIGLNDRNSDSSNSGGKLRTLGFLSTEQITAVAKTPVADDFIQFGFIPEFMGRVPILVTLNPLSRDDIKNILTKPKNAILKQYKKSFKSDGVVVTFSHDFIEQIVDEAEQKHLGARGLRGSIEQRMMGIMFELPMHPEIKNLEITPEIVDDPGIIREHIRIAATA